VKCLKELEDAIKLYTIFKARLYPTCDPEDDNEVTHSNDKTIDNYGKS
jgi:hypothetical protein